MRFPPINYLAEKKLMDNPYAAWHQAMMRIHIAGYQDGANGQVKAIEISLHNMCVWRPIIISFGENFQLEHQ